MRVLLITNLQAKKGLYRDSCVLEELLHGLGHEATAIDFRDVVDPRGFDLAIHLEVVRPDYFGTIKHHWWIPNPDWAKPEYLEYIDQFEYVLCKTADTERIFKERTPRTVFTGFTCDDRYDKMVDRERAFFHAHRDSIVKGTGVVDVVRQQIEFPLVKVRDLSEDELRREQNRCQFHLCPSEYEGWGHTIHEAMSVGAVIVSTDLPPMSEMKGIARLVPTDCTSVMNLARTGVASVSGLKDAVEWCIGLTDKEIKKYSREARQVYKEEDRTFRKTFGELLESNVTFVPQPIKVKTNLVVVDELPRETRALDNETVAVVIATYGDKERWDSLAERAIESVKKQTRQPDELIRVHGETLAEARNKGVMQSTSRWCLILDSDDELDPYYVASMLGASGDLRYPKVEVHENGAVHGIPSYGDLEAGNYCVIGSMFRKGLFEKVGGFLDEPIWEDWSLWLRMWRAGAKVEPSFSIYKVHYNGNGRNRQTEDGAYWAEEIRRRARNWKDYANNLDSLSSL